jgi:hypothetical protein
VADDGQMMGDGPYKVTFRQMMGEMMGDGPYKRTFRGAVAPRGRGRELVAGCRLVVLVGTLLGPGVGELGATVGIGAAAATHLLWRDRAAVAALLPVAAPDCREVRWVMDVAREGK